MEVITSFCWIAFTTSMPVVTWPKTVCTPSRCGCGAVTDEELAAAGVLAGVRHRERADHVLVRVALRLALDLVAGAAGADARVARHPRERVAALDDEVGDHAVELPS